MIHIYFCCFDNWADNAYYLVLDYDSQDNLYVNYNNLLTDFKNVLN